MCLCLGVYSPPSRSIGTSHCVQLLGGAGAASDSPGLLKVTSKLTELGLATHLRPYTSFFTGKFLCPVFKKSTEVLHCGVRPIAIAVLAI